MLLKEIFYSEVSTTAGDILSQLGEDFYIISNGRILDRDEVLDRSKTYRLCPRLRGGKGGFGSMLRTIGAQIEKTTNREAMRDLSGRRMRDVNNEKKLADWVAGAAEREAQQEERRQQRLEKRRAEAEGRMHNFRDEKYMEQKDTVKNNLDDALTQGLKRSSTTADSSVPSKKGKGKSFAASTAWAGMDIDDLSSSDDEEGRSSTSQQVKSELELIRGSVEPSPELSSAKEGTSTESSVKVKTRGDNTPDEPPETEVTDDQTEIEVTNGQSAITKETNDQTVDTKTANSQSATTEMTNDQPKKTKESNEIETQQPQSTDAPQSVADSIDLESHKCAEELETYGLERLKHELMRRGLKCGGTLVQRSERLFSVKGLSTDEIDPALLAKKRK